jgi:hypothetical protein
MSALEGQSGLQYMIFRARKSSNKNTRDLPVEEHIGRIGVNYKFTNCIWLFNCGAVVAKY